MFDPATTVVVYNPAASGGRVGREWNDLESGLRRRLGGVRFVRTTGPGDGIEKARAAVEDGATTIYSVGGDGTHNEIVNGILRADVDRTVELGILSAGTGGDFRRILSLPDDMLDAAQLLVRAEAHPIDVGLAELHDDDGRPVSRYFVNIAAAGINGLIVRMVNASRKRLRGTIPFAIGMTRAFFRYRPVEATVAVDGEPFYQGRISSVICANGRFFGGGMYIAPTARLADGLLDVTVIPPEGLITAVSYVPKLYRGTLSHVPEIVTTRGERIDVSITGPTDVFVDIDGESPGQTPVTFSCVPGAISLLGPRLDVL